MIQRTNLNMDKLFERNFKKVKKDGKVFYKRLQEQTIVCIKLLYSMKKRNFLDYLNTRKKIL